MEQALLFVLTVVAGIAGAALGAYLVLVRIGEATWRVGRRGKRG